MPTAMRRVQQCDGRCCPPLAVTFSQSPRKEQSMRWYETDWEFVTSGGFEITAGLGFQIGGGGGAFYTRNSATRNLLTLPYGVLGGGIAWGPFPLSVDGSVTEMRSGGIGKIWARDRRTLAPDHFEGFCTITNLQLGVIAGGSLALVAFGLPTPLSIMSDFWLFFAKAAGLLYSANVGFQFGAGAMGYNGYVMCLG
jgi:hypothetical protein